MGPSEGENMKAATRGRARTRPQAAARRARRLKVCTLARALAYRNEKVIQRFLDTYDVPEEEARALFHELKKWLWLCARAKAVGGPRLAVHGPLLMLDEMWHAFMQYTLDYQRYCLDRLGAFIHHLPSNSTDKLRERKRYEADPQGFVKRYQASLKRQYSFTYDELGDETLLKWYREYPKRYTPEFLERHRIPSTRSPEAPPPRSEDASGSLPGHLVSPIRPSV
jgi:hypothetical protein